MMMMILIIITSIMINHSVRCDTSLFSYYKNHEDFVSHKFEHFITLYEEYFLKYRNKDNFRLLEIGVQNGGSLQIWSSYFGPGSEIVLISVKFIQCF